MILYRVLSFLFCAYALSFFGNTLLRLVKATKTSFQKDFGFSLMIGLFVAHGFFLLLSPFVERAALTTLAVVLLTLAISLAFRKSRLGEFLNLIKGSVLPLLLVLLVGFNFFSSSNPFFWGAANPDLFDHPLCADLFKSAGFQGLFEVTAPTVGLFQYTLPAMFQDLSRDNASLDSLFYVLLLGLLLVFSANFFLAKELFPGQKRMATLCALLASSAALFVNTYFTGHVGTTLVLGPLMYLLFLIPHARTLNKVAEVLAISALLFLIYPGFLPLLLSFAAIVLAAHLPWARLRAHFVKLTLALLVLATTTHFFLWEYSAGLRLMATSRYRSWGISLTPKMIAIWLGALPPLSPTGYFGFQSYLHWTNSWGVWISGVLLFGLFMGALCFSRAAFSREDRFPRFMALALLAWLLLAFAFRGYVQDSYYFYKILYLIQPLCLSLMFAGLLATRFRKLTLVLAGIFLCLNWTWNLQTLYSIGQNPINKPNALPSREEVQKQFAQAGFYPFSPDYYNQTAWNFYLSRIWPDKFSSLTPGCYEQSYYMSSPDHIFQQYLPGALGLGEGSKNLVPLSPEKKPFVLLRTPGTELYTLEPATISFPSGMWFSKFLSLYLSFPAPTPTHLELKFRKGPGLSKETARLFEIKEPRLLEPLEVILDSFEYSSLWNSAIKRQQYCENVSHAAIALSEMGIRLEASILAQCDTIRTARSLLEWSLKLSGHALSELKPLLPNENWGDLHELKFLEGMASLNLDTSRLSPNTLHRVRWVLLDEVSRYLSSEDPRLLGLRIENFP